MRDVGYAISVHDTRVTGIRGVGVLARFPKGVTGEGTVTGQVNTDTGEELVNVLVGMAHLQERDNHLLEEADVDEVPQPTQDELTLALPRGVVQLQVQDLR